MNEDEILEGIYDIQKRLGDLENGQQEIKQTLTNIEGKTMELNNEYHGNDI